jgi:dihydroflavonol-4-reductase
VNERVLVTGGTGFVAGWCIVELDKRGYAVRTTVRQKSSQPAGVEIFIADLTKDDGWDQAMDGVDYVLHVASPLGTDEKDPDMLVRAARDGTLRVLKAATRAGVKRVVMTSSTAACTGPGGVPGDETVWTDPDERGVNAYRRSKILAERAAWDYVRSDETAPELTTILPGAIFGPVLTKANLGSVELIQRLLTGRPPALPRVGFTVIDVRDLADLHIRAMTEPAAAGERFIAAGQFMTFADMAGVLRSNLGARAAKVPTREAPDFLVRLLARFIAPLRALVPLLGSPRQFSAAKVTRVLGFAPRPGAETIVDCAESLALPEPSRA